MSNLYFNNQNKPKARDLGVVLTQLRSVLNGLDRHLADMNQMSDDDISEQYDFQASTGGNTAVQNAAAFKAELASDWAMIDTETPPVTPRTGLAQLLAKAGY